MVGWPTRKQYVAAIQRAAATFREPSLQRAAFQTDLLGMPALSSGQTAIVFKADVDGKPQAVRVFTTETRGGQARYRALSQHLRSNTMPSIAAARWIDDALDVEDTTYPVVVMDWVDGASLSTAIEDRLDSPDRLESLAEQWCRQIADLRAARVAHGDLQHGNVLVDNDERLRFIDLDGVWIPGIADQPPGEFGHPNYQHPDRTSGVVWGEHIDWFSALVIYVSLRALAMDPSLWRYHNGDNLIFRDEDFRGAAPIWKDLRALGGEVADLGQLLAESCNADPLSPTDLDAVLRAGTAPTATKDDASGSGYTTTTGDVWWNTSAGAGTTATPGPRPEPPRRPSGHASTPDPPRRPTGTGAPRQRATKPKEQVRAEWGDVGPHTPPPPPQQPRGPGGGGSAPGPSGPTIGGVTMTPTQWETVEAYAGGLSIDEIAAARGLSARTIKGHLRHVCRLAQVPSLNDLPAWLATHGVPITPAVNHRRVDPPRGGRSVPPPSPASGQAPANAPQPPGPPDPAVDNGGPAWAARAAGGSAAAALGIALGGGGLALIAAALVLTAIFVGIWLLAD
ncbi:MAG: hypothetical protein AAF467_01350 [Actinomycetota bacterium]